MKRKFSSHCHFILLKDYRFLKVIFTLFAMYLVSETLYTYFVEKPTYASHEKREISVDDFPDITLCPMPSMDLGAARSKGYPDPEAYFRGSINPFSWTHIGWAGNQSGDIKELAREISILKSINDCPIPEKSILLYEENEVSQNFIANITFELKKVLFPYHICCKLIQPELSTFQHPIKGLQLVFPSMSHVDTLQVYMADQLTASYFDLHKTTMLGDKIVSGNNGSVYKVRIKEDIKLQDDTKNPCTDYNIKGEYANCVENVIIERNMKFLNCTPHWMTNNEDLWCTGNYKHNSSLINQQYSTFMNEITISEGNPGKCLVPCKEKRYMVKEIGLPENSFKGTRIWFENKVQVTKSGFNMDIMDVISKTGSFIGISKNLLWIIILLTSSVSVIISHLKLKSNK